MTLKNIASSNKEVLIVTDRYANEGRFFSGISPKFKHEINCTVELFNQNSFPHCFITSNTVIKKG